MPGILNAHITAVRMAVFRRAHPDVTIYKAQDGMWLGPEERSWRAVIPLGGNSERILAGPGQEALLDKLDRAMAGR